MPDREKVIERLKRVSYYFKRLLAVGWQGDADIYREHRESVNMAISLLKEQEPIAPKGPKTVYAYAFACGNCEACVDRNWIACPRCGRRIKWDA